MPVNTNPLFIGTPTLGTPVLMTSNSAQVDSTGASAGNGATRLWQIFASGANGAFIERVKFMPVYTSAVNSIATALRVYISSEIGGANATTAANTMLLGELTVPITAVANMTVPTPTYEVILNLPMPPNRYILVSQATSQGAGGNGSWQAWAHNCGVY